MAIWHTSVIVKPQSHLHTHAWSTRHDGQRGTRDSFELYYNNVWSKTLSLVNIFGAQQHQQHSGDRIKLSDLRQHFFFHALRISFVEFISSSIATPWLTEILGTNPTIRPILHADGHSSLVFLLIICVVVFVWLLHSQMWVNDFGRNEGVCQKKKRKQFTFWLLSVNDRWGFWLTRRMW